MTNGSRIALSLWLAAACAAPRRPAPPPRPPEPPRSASPAPAAPVLVVLVVDQLASWVFESRRHTFAANGGFTWLLERGTYVPELRYEHATTSTAPGHAALYTGLPARDSGILANERFDDARLKPLSYFHDPSTQLVHEGVLDAKSSSAAALRAPTLADALRAQRPEALIVSLSLKDRAAVPGGGTKPDVSIWFDSGRLAFVSSTAYHRELPSFVQAANRRLAAAASDRWQPSDLEFLRHHSPTSDAQPGEGDLGAGVAFPYDLARAANRGVALRGQPVADRALLALAEGALKALAPERDATRPTLLAISLSAFDYVGHVNGPDSWESWQTLRELDEALGAFLRGLSQRFGPRLSVMLSADHGVGVLPETAGNERARPWCRDGQASPVDRFERPCGGGRRLQRNELFALLRKLAESELGGGNWVRAVLEPFAYFTASYDALPEPRRVAFEAAAVAALEQHPGVAKVLPVRAFRGPCPPAQDESLSALVCRAVPATGNDLYIVPGPGSFFDPHIVPGTGINHGTPYLYDRSVPLLVARADGRGAGDTLRHSVGPRDFTATAAALLGITPPAGAAEGRPIGP